MVCSFSDWNKTSKLNYCILKIMKIFIYFVHNVCNEDYKKNVINIF